METRFAFLVATILLVCSCSNKQQTTVKAVNGYWLTDANQQVMLDPQTSGLAKWRGGLASISDGSAKSINRLKILSIDPTKADVSIPRDKFEMSQNVKSSCFADYLSVEPDFEALVVDPDNDNVFILVTEDASRSGFLSDSCAVRFANTGSTNYPTLLVRLELMSDGQYVMTHVRPLQYQPKFNVGNAPNDGIEGLAMSSDRTLYLGLEKDAEGQPRIFSTTINSHFWSTDAFVEVDAPNLKLPKFESGNHPINGMDLYLHQNGKEYLLAAARNDNQLWVIDVSGDKPTAIVDLSFMAEIFGGSDQCSKWEKMDNASIEGVAVDGDTLWMVNDPWKVNYHKNIQCEANRPGYESMAPLLFSMPIDSTWFH
jgi:hypothetical protein